VDAREYVAQVGPGVELVELGRLDQAHDDGRALAGRERPAKPSFRGAFVT
jgi:hypothetical protein